jgi:peptidyl-prolyl cis-trans isomerase D
MLSLLRRYTNTWPVRALLGLLVAFLVFWGIASSLQSPGDSATTVATVSGETIDRTAMQQAFQRQMAQVARMFGPNYSPTPEMRRSIADRALQQLVTEATIDAHAHRMGMTVTDEAVRTEAFANPAFKGPSGQFDKNTFARVLRTQGFDENSFEKYVRGIMLEQQLLSAVRAGATAPDTLVAALFGYQQEKRIADAVFVPFATAPAPPAPTEAELEHWWANNPEQYARPEYRRIKAVILSTQTIARDITIPDEAVTAAYEQQRNVYNVDEKRSVQILLTADEARAEALAAQWRSGADWAQMQHAATDAGGTAVELPNADRAELPDPSLADAVFAAAPETVPPPIHDPLGWHVVKVTAITPARHTSFDDIKDTLRKELAEQQAAEQVYDRSTKVEDALAGGGGLDELPADLGLAAVTGTLDAHGNTPEGTPAPIPAEPSVRDAIINAAFQAKPGDPIRLTEVPAQAEPGKNPGPSAYYALVVESITPPAGEPFDQVRERVRADWTRNAIHHATEATAAGLLAAVKGGQSLADAAAAASLTVHPLPPTDRQNAPQGFPAQLQQPLFGMKIGEPGMVETADGFVVAVLAEIQVPDARTDPIGYGQARQALQRAVGDDIITAYVNAVRLSANPRVNTQVLNSIVQP